MAEEIVLGGPKTTLQEDLTRLYSQGFLTDITLSTEDGKNFEAHKILLAARSHYFHSIVPRMRTSEPVIFLKGVKGAHLDKILKYIYSGSVSLSRHQLKPILEVAKSLQVKGLLDANPADILSRQGLTGPSPSALQAIASRTGANPAVLAARAAQKPLTSPPASNTSFKSSPSSSAASSAVNRANRSRFMSSTSKIEDDSDSDDEIVLNKSKQEISDLDDDDDENDDEDDDDKKPESTPVKPMKRKRGRPPKNKKSDGPASNDKSNDPYEFDADEAGTSGHMRTSSADKGKSYRIGGKKSKDDEEEDSASASRRDRSNKYSATSINGKQILSVKCKNQTAELHLSKFANGMRGNSIKYKDQWMTPQQFEEACGTSNHKYLENIQTDYGPLKTLTASGMLKPHSRKCRCSVCRGEETSPKSDKLKPKKRPKNDDEEAGEEEEDEEATEVVEQKESHEDHEQQTHEDEEHQHHHKDKKRKKKKHLRDEWRKQLLADQLKQEAANQQHQQQHQQQQQQQQQHQHPQHHHQPQTITIVDETPAFDHQNQLHHMQIHQPQGEIYVTAMSSLSNVNPTFVSTLSDMPPKISTPTNMVDTVRIEPPQHAQPPTFYVMSPHPHLAPPTPQHNPFAAMGPPPPQSPAPSIASHISSPSSNANIKSQNGLKDSSGSNASTPTSTSSNVNTGNVPRMGPVMNVRCKSTTAVMYTAKYESGSKGKCIQLGDEWLTPNEFEDRAGSKAKKYLSSIKCLGRPLRVFVNSGELKGSGPPPTPKVTKKVKPSAVQPIAPAPPPGSGMLTPAPMGQITAPPTPSHISSAPPIPANLNMVMSGHNQPPILINQTSMPSQIIGNQAMMAPMTFTIGTPLDVRQNAQAM